MLEWTTGDDFSSGGNRLVVGGWFHLLITSIDPHPKKFDGSLLTNAFLGVTAEVLAGSVPNQKGKVLEFTLMRGALTDRDGGKFSREKVDRFLFAIGIVRGDQKKSALKLDEQAFLGSQFVAHVIQKTSAKGSVFAEVQGKSFYHVDDPEIKDQLQLDAAMLSLLPAARRIVPSPTAAGVPDDCP